ncbi:MAG: hypothetical protein WC356_04880 [Candidatus Micrarchaeia archaeon]|jgi:Tfp pilus assembly protein PilN
MILSFLFSKIGAYLIGGLLIAGLVGGGYFYVSHLRSENALLTQEVSTQKDTIEFFKKAAKIDIETKEHKDEIKEVIQSGDPQRVHDLLRKLRQLSAPPTN